jgi:FtsP/CotA-like multicopper oxidase with cupredoxin domain
MALDEHRLAPFPARPPPQNADTTLRFTVNMTTPSTWVLNAAPHEFFRQNVPPLLWDKGSRGPTEYGNETGFLKNGTVVDLIVENAAGVNSMHPFHKHNHKVWIIGQGDGGFPYNSTADGLKSEKAKDINLVDPPYKDGFKLEAGEGRWTIVRYEIFFPAVSMLHCHMIHHFAVSLG